MDLRLYLVTDRELSKGRSNLDIVKAAVAGGVTVVQLRDKSASAAELIRQARSMLPFLRAHGVPLIVNDHLDVALAVESDGVHLGQDDMPLAMARRIAGDQLVIGVSAESVDDAVAAADGGADYIGVSPVYVTATKTDTAPALGLEGVRAIRKAVTIPVVGIGGMNALTCADTIRAGADGVAVVSAIVSAAEPELAAKELRAIVDEALKA